MRQLASGAWRGLRRALPALAIGGTVVAVGAGIYGGYYYLTHATRFAIDHIAVSGQQALTVDDVRAALPVRSGTNIFRADLDAAEAALERLPWVADADVHRELPRTVRVIVREHIAHAVVELDGLFLADAKGTPFKRLDTSRGEGQGLPVITGIGRARYVADPNAATAQIAGALEVITAWQASGRPRVRELDLDARGAVTLNLAEAVVGEAPAGALQVRLGVLAPDVKPALEAQLRRFDVSWAQLTVAERGRARALYLDQTTRAEHVTVAFASPSSSSPKSSPKSSAAQP